MLLPGVGPILTIVEIASNNFLLGRCWHAGVEGRISVLQRAHGLRRCLDHGSSGFERWVGWGIIAGNLKVMGRA